MDASDEFFHVPNDDPFWSESHYFDFVGEDRQGHVRLGFYPNRDRANLFAYLVDGETVYALRDDEIPPAATHGLAVTTEDVEFVAKPRTIGEEWTVELDGRFRRCATAPEVLAVEGPPVDVSLAATYTYRHDPFLYSDGRDFPAGEDEDRYEVAAHVEGEATIDDEEWGFETVGERDHSWGTRRWTDAEWLWISGAFEDGTAYNHLTFWLPDFPDQRYVNGFWYDGTAVNPLTDATVEATPAFGTETARAWMQDGDSPGIEIALEWDGGETTIEVDPFATTPVDWIDEDAGQRAVLNRSPARQTRDGTVAGDGFLENMTQLPHSA